MAPAGTTGLSAYQTIVGSAERTTAEELASAWVGTSGRRFKVPTPTYHPPWENTSRWPKSVMFSALKIEQEFSQKHAISDD